MTARTSGQRADGEARLAAALKERDAALEQLAQARAQVNALRLQLRHEGERAPQVYPVGVTPGSPPLRYVVVDQLNDFAKRATGPLHSGIKGLSAKLFGAGESK